MKKAMFLLIFTVAFFSIPLIARAEDDYSDIYDQSGMSDIENSLDESTKSFFTEQNIDVSNADWINGITSEGVFGHIWSFIKSGAKTPLRAGFSMLSVILISSLFKFYRQDKALNTALKFAVSLAVIGIIFSGVLTGVTETANLLKGSSSFMLSFVPVYMGILSASGAPVTAATSGGMILMCAEFSAAAAAFGQSAIIGAYLALSVSAGVSPITEKSSLADIFKKTGLWIMTLLSTVFLGLLAAKTSINSAADSVTLKTAKYIIGTCVPVAGNALSGAVSTVSASLGVLKTSVGIYGVVALAVMFLPILAELLLWRLVLLSVSAIGSVFSADEISRLLKAVDGVFSLLIGALIMVAATFIISLATVVSLGRGI